MSAIDMERNKEIIKLRDSGMEFKDIGEMYGISSQRAAQICRLYGEKVDRSKYGGVDDITAESDVFTLLMRQPKANPIICKKIYDLLWSMKSAEKSEVFRPTLTDISMVSDRTIAKFERVGDKLISVYASARKVVMRDGC